MITVRWLGRAALAAWTPVWLAGAGCGGGADFGESLMVPQEKHTRLDANFSAGRPLRLPVDVPFNVTDAQRFSSGEAMADSSAAPTGQARCRATAHAGGTAWAEFELGHVLANPADEPVPATVTFRVTYSYRTSAEPTASSATPDKFALKVVIVDSNRRVLKRMMLAELEPAKGPSAWSGTQSPSFDITLEPRLAYHLVVAGRVEVSGTSERAPSAEIEVTSLEIEVVPMRQGAAGVSTSSAWGKPRGAL